MGFYIPFLTSKSIKASRRPKGRQRCIMDGLLLFIEYIYIKYVCFIKYNQNSRSKITCFCIDSKRKLLNATDGRKT